MKYFFLSDGWIVGRVWGVGGLWTDAGWRRQPDIQKLNVSAVDAVRKIYQRGCKAGVFRSGIEPLDIHMTISALSFFNASNRHTFSLIFKHDMASAKAHAARRASVVEAVARFVRK